VAKGQEGLRPADKRHPLTAQALEKRTRALELRRAGLTYRQIGEQIGLSSTAAWKHVKTGIDAARAEIAETGAEVLELELDRLDGMLRALWPKVLAGDTDAIRTSLRVQERRARYLGLDQADKLEVSGPGGGPIRTTHEIHAELLEKANRHAEALEMEADANGVYVNGNGANGVNGHG